MGVTEQKPDKIPRHRGRLPSGFTTVRDILSFVFGAAIIVNEVFIEQTVEPMVIAIGATMFGLPVVFNADERKRGGGDGADGDENQPPRSGA